MAIQSERESRNSAPYVRTFAYLQSKRSGRPRRIPRLGLACAAALAVAIATWQGRPGESPPGRNETLRTITADPRPTTAGVASAPELPTEPSDAAVVSADGLPADDFRAEEASHPLPEAPTPVTETPRAEPSQAPLVGPPASQVDVASAASVRRNRTARAGSSVHAIRRLLDRYAVEVESDQYAEGDRDLDVQVHLLSIREEGDRTVVRFTRQHRYRDALGRLVLKETPPMQTTVVKTAGGVRFERPPI